MIQFEIPCDYATIDRRRHRKNEATYDEIQHMFSEIVNKYVCHGGKMFSGDVSITIDLVQPCKSKRLAKLFSDTSRLTFPNVDQVVPYVQQRRRGHHLRSQRHDR